MFQIAIQTAPVTTPKWYVAALGTEPNNSFPPGTTSADFGDGYELASVDDDSQLLVIEDNEFCYLSDDRLSLYGGSEPT